LPQLRRRRCQNRRQHLKILSALGRFYFFDYFTRQSIPMAKKILYGSIAILLIVLAIVGRFFFPNTSFGETSRTFYIPTGKNNRAEVIASLHDLIRNPKSFGLLADQ